MKTKLTGYAFLVLTGFGLNACLNEEPPFKDNGNYGIVELDLAARSTATPFATREVSLGTGDVVEIPVVVNYTGVQGTPSDVEVTLAIDVDAVALYAAAVKDNITLLPDGAYRLPPSATLTIPKGEKKAAYTITVTKSALDVNVKTYGIGVGITHASGGTVSGNYSTGIYLLR